MKNNHTHIGICFYLFLFFIFYLMQPKFERSKPIYIKAIQIANRLYDGINFLAVQNESMFVIRNGYDYKKNIAGRVSFDVGLSSISLYYGTGDERFLFIAKKTADLLNKMLPKTGLVPQIGLKDSIVVLVDDSITYSSASQATLLEFVCQLAKVDSSYKKLVTKLADGLINYGINPKNHQPYFAINTYSGSAIYFPEIGYESQLGSVSSNVADALITAYEITQNIKYKKTSLQILKSIWDRRNKTTNLIPETWDIVNDTIGIKMYPYGKFRYDDMAGAYIRALMSAYSQTKDTTIFIIMNLYSKSIMRYVWDENIAEGGFRYLTSIEDGKGLSELETMYGLFIGTMLRCSKFLSDLELKEEILKKCKKHADNVFLTDYGVKHSMIPHNLNAGGKISSKSNDSQLGYAVLQFPYGMQLLSLMTGNNLYRERCFQIMDTLIARHEIGDNINSPKGYVNIIETTPPFGFENDYYTPTWCYEFEFLPSYLLYASVQPSEDVQINWKDGNEPNVYWLCGGMPYWDLDKVKFDYKKKLFTCEAISLSNTGNIKFDDLGFEEIKEVKCDEKPYNNFDENTLELIQGNHFYKIIFN